MAIVTNGISKHAHKKNNFAEAIALSFKKGTFIYLNDRRPRRGSWNLQVFAVPIFK